MNLLSLSRDKKAEEVVRKRRTKLLYISVVLYSEV
jgi:hypothetical protein